MNVFRINNPFYIILRGLPGAGKSTVSKIINTQLRVSIIDPDQNRFINGLLYRVNRVFVNNKSNLKLETYLYRKNILEARNTIKEGNTFIWNQCWPNINGIIYTINSINHLTNYSLVPIIIELNTPLELIKSRLSSKRWLKGKSLDYYIDRYTSFTENKDKYFVIRLTKTTSKQYAEEILMLLCKNKNIIKY